MKTNINIGNLYFNKIKNNENTELTNRYLERIGKEFS